MNNSCEERSAESSTGFYQMNILSESTELLNIEKQETPATVGCAYERHNKAETLSATGWTALPDHPLRISSHSLVGLENQSMLLIGGYAFESGYQTGIWQLNDKEWSQFGKLLQPGGYGSALYDNRFIYFFAGDPHPYAIQRLELNESEKLEKVEVMGNQRGQFFSPVLVKTDYFCG
ncbi:unnamed protein product [Oikopleura dioica]|uniref:Uncharacterized protein n=1 Tax=Oikopleura dioica TaxID=34765 RepID=E4YE44_OIKDI|nr:unnamed protein product [Oikopleura dioica]